MEPQERKTLDGIFNASTVPYKGKQRPLRFTIAAELYLEKYGIHLGTLAEKMKTEPTTTILRLVFAGLPAREFRERQDFESFVRALPEQDAQEMVKRVDWILGCFFRQILGAYEEKKSFSENDVSVKKN